MDNALSEDHAARHTGRTKASVSALAGDGKTQVEELTGRATVAAEHVYGQARDQVREAATVVARSVEQQPFIALVAVGLICATVGFLLARR
jgi:hypothetical protein